MKPHFKTVGDVMLTNRLYCTEAASAYSVALKLLEADFHGLPVLDDSGQVVGKLTEIDLLRALKAGRDLKTTAASEIMAPAPPSVGPLTPIEEAVQIMDANHLIRLPVVEWGRLVGNVTRHDLLRAWLGVWLDHGRRSYAEVIG